VCGTCINFYIYGRTAIAPLVQNLLSYLMMICMPEKYFHIAVFFVAAVMLGLA
jgi:hypothetical protein